VLEQLNLYRSELGWLGSFRVPVIAAINGAALGGGLELALACDLRVAREGAVLGLPETSLGIIPGAGGTQRLPRIVGEAKAKELILLGQRLTAEQALAVGLVSRVIPAADALLEATFAFIRPISEGAPIAQAAALRALRAASLPLEEGLAVELSAYQECLGSEDRREALLAFQEQRPPRFQGRRSSELARCRSLRPLSARISKARSTPCSKRGARAYDDNWCACRRAPERPSFSQSWRG
jgi:1,4-dihydroxy-2-naphthoyl-CoA synthase